MVASLPVSFILAFSTFAAGATLQVSGIPQPGGPLSVSGSGLPHKQRLALTWDGSTAGMAAVHSDSNGTFTTQIIVPTQASLGDHTLGVRSIQKGKSKTPKPAVELASVTIRVVTGSPTPTPRATATDPTPLPTSTPKPTLTPAPTPTTTPTPTGTPSSTPSGDPVISAAGDIACATPYTPTTSTCQHAATARLLSSAAVVLALGDLQYETGSLTQFNASYDATWGVYKSKTRPSVGNHEYGTSNAQGYRDYFGFSGPLYYSYDVGTWHIIALDSNCGSGGGCAVGTTQYNWLVDDLNAHPAQCTLAYWHHPRFSTGQHGNNTTYTPFWQVLYDHDVDLVLNGHDHDYERFAPQTPAGNADNTRGIREFVVGTGGRSHYTTSGGGLSQVRSSDTFGILNLTLHPSSYDWRFVPIAGQSFSDVGSGACH